MVGGDEAVGDGDGRGWGVHSARGELVELEGGLEAHAVASLRPAFGEIFLRFGKTTGCGFNGGDLLFFALSGCCDAALGGGKWMGEGFLYCGS